MPLRPEDIGTLVQWLGADGALAGLENSTLSNAELRLLLGPSKQIFPSKVSREQLIIELIFGNAKRIDKPLDELLSLNEEKLLEYLKKAKPSYSELTAVLAELNFKPDSEAKKNLYRYAARQISQTGMFQRVAKGPR